MTNLNVKSIKMDEARKVIEQCIKIKVPILLHGQPGIGKSEMVKNIASSLGGGMQLIDLRLSQFPAEDIAGLPIPVKLDGKYKTIRSLPDFLPKDKKSEGILFLDEINQANPSVLNAIFQLILDRKVAGNSYTLPEGWAIVAACNDAEYNRDVTEFQPPLNDRFLHIKVEPDAKSWLSWAKKNEVNKLVLSYIRSNPKSLAPIDNLIFDTVVPTPRSWKRVSDFENLDLKVNMLKPILDGLLGYQMSAEYLLGTQAERDGLNLREILLQSSSKPFTMPQSKAPKETLIKLLIDEFLEFEEPKEDSKAAFNLIRCFKLFELTTEQVYGYISSMYESNGVDTFKADYKKASELLELEFPVTI